MNVTGKYILETTHPHKSGFNIVRPRRVEFDCMQIKNRSRSTSKEPVSKFTDQGEDLGIVKIPVSTLRLDWYIFPRKDTNVSKIFAD